VPSHMNVPTAARATGTGLGGSESYAGWTEYFSWFKQRRSRGVDLVVSDHHKGLVNEIETQFQGASWQRCQTHFMWNILDATPKQLQKEVHDRLVMLFRVPDVETDRELLNGLLLHIKERRRVPWTCSITVLTTPAGSHLKVIHLIPSQFL